MHMGYQEAPELLTAAVSPDAETQKHPTIKYPKGIVIYYQNLDHRIPYTSRCKAICDALQGRLVMFPTNFPGWLNDFGIQIDGEFFGDQNAFKQIQDLVSRTTQMSPSSLMYYLPQSVGDIYGLFPGAMSIKAANTKEYFTVIRPKTEIHHLHYLPLFAQGFREWRNTDDPLAQKDLDLLMTVTHRDDFHFFLDEKLLDYLSKRRMIDEEMKYIYPVERKAVITGVLNTQYIDQTALSCDPHLMPSALLNDLNHSGISFVETGPESFSLQGGFGPKCRSIDLVWRNHLDSV
jgi:hypothetical protein